MDREITILRLVAILGCSWEWAEWLLSRAQTHGYLIGVPGKTGVAIGGDSPYTQTQQGPAGPPID